MPGSNSTTSVSFANDIKPLFRDSDRRAMLFLFDLWSRDDVNRNANRILAIVRAGVMPCDTTWPDHDVELFKHWIDGGSQP